MSVRGRHGPSGFFQHLPLTAKGALVVALPVIALAIGFALFYDPARGLNEALTAGSIAGLLGALAAMYLFVRAIVRRIHRVDELARSVAGQGAERGKLASGDEISRLEKTLHETAGLLADQQKQLRAAHDEMERRVEQRTAELSRANEELRHANEMRQSLIRSAPLAIFSLDLEGRVVFWSLGAERTFGFTAEEAIGEVLPTIPPGRRDDFEANIVKLRNGETMEAVERAHQRKDGTKVDAAIWAVPQRDDTGKINGFLTFVADITERKQLEEQFRQSQKLEAVGRLAGGVAHDFNNLLTVIMGYVEMLASEAVNSPGLLEYAEEIQSAADRASALTGQLLAFSRRQIAQPRAFDLNQTIEHSIKLLGRVIGEDISIRTRLDPGLAMIKADPTHVDQAIMNLVVNARDAMPEGGLLTIETANVMLDDDYAGRHLGVKPGVYAMLAISDTGVGMTPEIRERIFEPFFTTKESGKGTGLGLSIVYGVVKQNSGDIIVYSEPGHGTSFKLYFPAEQAPAELVESQLNSADLRGAETILVCEDEERIRKLVTIMLAKQGYRVLEADTPAAAIAHAREHFFAIDLLLTDIVMPNMNGVELAKAVREARPGVKLLYMSGYSDNRASDAWVLDPDTPFLHKPFTASTLARKVREALGALEASRAATESGSAPSTME
jgi:two-component system, cell cycle sensor histidine kinase and response regulator CckA